jgi:EAL and modified HD-GYP domain-containing signal transduction protein
VALDDFVLRPEYQQLLEIADVVKVEINRCAREEQSRLIASCHRRGTKMLAEKLETYEEFEWARRAGYDYFQGYFFARPVVVRARQIPAVKLNCLRLLAEAQRPELDFYRLERMIEADVSFSYKLLRYVNSALFACKTEIRSITQALALAGETDLRHWIALAALPRVAVDKPEELTVQSLVRARFGESIARLLGLDLAHEAFLMGLFSMLDALIDLPMDEALSQVSLAQEITTVLTGLALDDDPLCRIYKLLRAYEAADWDRVLNLAGELGLRAQCLSEAYCKALRWVHESLSMTG